MLRAWPTSCSRRRLCGLASALPCGDKAFVIIDRQKIGMDRRRQAGVFHEGESVGHAPRPTHFDFCLCSEIARPTDGFQLIELGKLSVVDGIKLTFDAKAASAHSNIIGANQGPATTSGYASTVRQTPRYSAPSRPPRSGEESRFSAFRIQKRDAYDGNCGMREEFSHRMRGCTRFQCCELVFVSLVCPAF